MTEQITKRPLVCAALALIFGMLASQMIWVVVPLLALAYYAAGSARLIVAAFALLGSLITPALAPMVYEKTPFSASGVIDSIPTLSSNRERFEATFGTQRYLVSVAGDHRLGKGDRVEVVGTLGPLPQVTEVFHRKRGINGAVKASFIQVLSKGPWIYQVGEEWRRDFRAQIARHVPSFWAEMANALCFNLSQDLDEPLLDDLKTTGTVHIISASGAHVAILALFIDWILSMFPVKREVRLLLLVGVLLLYTVAAGFNAPIIRASIMIMIVVGAYIHRRDPDGLSALALAALIALLLKPSALFEPGFQLSFSVLLGFVTLLKGQNLERENAYKKAILRTKQLATVSLVATYMSAPILAYWTGGVSLIGVVANLAIAPVLPFLVVVPMVSQPLSHAVPDIAGFGMQWIFEPLCGWLVVSVTQLAKVPFAWVQVPVFSLFWVAPYYGIWALVWRKRLDLP